MLTVKIPFCNMYYKHDFGGRTAKEKVLSSKFYKTKLPT